MLQLAALNRRVELGPTPGWSTMEELERAADARLEALRRSRAERARPGLERLGARLDALVRTDALESLDRADHPDTRKLAQVRLLHLQNLALRSYQRTLRILGPVISEARARRGDRPVRVLELASGAGEMTMALAAEAARRGWPLEVTGSDVVPSYVARANALAEARGSRARFRVIDGFALADSLAHGEVDVVLVAQSAHHFSAGQLAKVIAQVEAAGGTHVVIVDGHRSVRMLVALPTIALVGLDRHFAHDAWISARRFYSEPELELVARIAAPRATVTSRCETPLTTVLTVAFAGRT